MKGYSKTYVNPLMQPRKGLEVKRIRDEITEEVKRLQEKEKRLADWENRLAAMTEDLNAHLEEKIRDELEKATREGITRGWLQAQESMQTKLYASVAITLKELLKFGKTRITRFLNEVDKMYYDYIDSDEACADALKRAGVELDFSEVFSEDRIKEISECLGKKMNGEKQ